MNDKKTSVFYTVSWPRWNPPNRHKTVEEAIAWAESQKYGLRDDHKYSIRRWTIETVHTEGNS